MILRSPKTEPTVSSKTEASPRFNKIVLLESNDVDFFIHETILSSINLAIEIKREIQEQAFLESLRKVELLSEVPEFIFLDIHTIGLDGIRFLEEFNKLPDFIKSKCKIVVISLRLDPDVEIRMKAYPSVVRFLTKPLDLSQMKDFMLLRT